MTETVEPKPQFQSHTKDAVMAALADPDPQNPIAVEVACLIEGYTANFQRHVERLGYMPINVLRIKPRSSIEAVAMQLTTESIRETVAKP